MYSLQFKVKVIVYSSKCSVQFIVQCIVYSSQCSVQCTVHSVVYSVQCTVHSAVWVRADWVQKSEMIVLLKVRTILSFLCNPENIKHCCLEQFEGSIP